MEIKLLGLLLIIGLVTFSEGEIELPPGRDVTSPPVLTHQPSGSSHQIAYKTGEKVTLPCQASGNPVPSYKWFKDGKPLVIQGPAIRMRPGSGTIIITSPVSDDEGEYQCFADNAHGTAVSLRAMLKRAVLDTFPTVPQAKEHAPLVGDKLTLRCNPPHSYPEGLLYWAILRPGDKFSSLTGTNRVTVDYDGNLHISNVQSSDYQNGKTYYCAVQNHLLNSLASGEDQLVSPLEATPTFRAPEIMWSSNNNPVALQGLKIKMKCIFAGYPTPNVTWERVDGKPLSPHAVKRNFGMELFIPNVHMSDTGKYECRANNTETQQPVRRSFNLRVEASPTWDKEPEDLVASEEEDVSFECIAKGIPKPTIGWTFNGVPFDGLSGGEKARMKIEDNKVSFRNLTKDDAKVLQCNATNEHGYIFSNAYLNVLAEPPTIMTKPQANLKVAEGKKAVLTCRAFGAPKPVIVWKVEGKKVSGDRFTVLESGDLSIDPVAIEDTGKFYCHADNKFGHEESAGGLLVRAKTTIEEGPQTQSVNATDEVIFECKAKTDPAEKLTITWLKDGQPIDFTKNNQLSLNTNDNSLIIKKAKVTDTAKYTCVADNGLDQDNVTATLIVKDRPDAPKELNIPRCASTSIRIQWVPGSENNEEVTAFHIYYNTTFDEEGMYHKLKSEPKGKKAYTYKNPSPWANYTFHIRAENSMGMSDRSVFSTVCKVGPDIPSKNPDNVCLDSRESNELVITWDRMEKIDHNGDNFVYVVGYQRQDISNAPEKEQVVKEWETTSLTIPGVPTFTEYEVFVKARNEMGVSKGPLQKKVGYSGEGTPLDSPEGFAIDENTLNSTYAEFTWDGVDQSPARVQGYFRGYRIKYWKTGDSDNAREQDVILNAYEPCKDSGAVSRGRRQAGGGAERAHVADLWPYNKISAGVMVLNGKHTGDIGDIIEFETPEGVPGAVAGFGVKEHGSHHLKLWWTPPMEKNGILISYVIGYAEINDQSSFKELVVGNPLQTSFNLKNLQENTKYALRLWAQTRMGRGKVMTAEDQTLMGGPPDVPGVSNIGIGDDSFNVTWEPSEGQKKNPGSDFVVKYREKGSDDWITVYPEENEKSANVTGLVAGQEYEVMVVAKNGAGESESKITVVRVGPKEAEQAVGVASTAWFVGLICIIIFLLLILLIVCLIKRNRGGKYPVHEKEKLRGRDPDKDDEEGGFGEYTRADEPDLKKSNRSLNSEEKPLDSETDSLYDDYGDTSKFNEDGSFIGQYGGKKSDEKPAEPDATSPSALSTFV